MINNERFKPLRKYCKEVESPTLGQWQWWIYTKNQIALKCVKKIGCRYWIDVEAFQDYLLNASLEK